MEKLIDIVELALNDEEAVFLKVKENKCYELQLLGFTGNETGFRITKGYEHIFTKYYIIGGESRGAYIVWNDGEEIHTDRAALQQIYKVTDCIEEFGIKI